MIYYFSEKQEQEMIKTEMRQRVIELVEQLPQEMLSEAIELIESLSIKSKLNQSLYSREEKSLIETIQYRLSLEEQKHVDYLREQNEQGLLTQEEHIELIKYIEKVEELDVARTEALIKLAKLYNVSLDILIKEFSSIQENN